MIASPRPRSASRLTTGGFSSRPEGDWPAGVDQLDRHAIVLGDMHFDFTEGTIIAVRDDVVGGLDHRQLELDDPRFAKSRCLADFANQ
jgi:hypothetical protein